MIVEDKYLSQLDIYELLEGKDVSLNDLLFKYNLSVEDLFFLRDLYDFSTEEITQYNKLCHIKGNDLNIIQSDNIENSRWIYYSSKIVDSKYINYSESIISSSEIVTSRNVSKSNDIYGSELIINSERIIFSKNVEDSYDIIHSTNVSWSNTLINCNNVDGSAFSYYCENINDCYFCGFMNNCDHCLFCDGLNNCSYFIFNKEVDINTFEQIFEYLLFLLNGENSHIVTINSQKHFIERVSFIKRLDEMFTYISPEFLGWIGSLPQFDEFIFFSIFFKDFNLIFS